MKRLFIALATAATLGLGVAAIAGPPGHHGPPGIEGHILRVMHDLDLTEAQRAQLREIREAGMAEREALRAEREETMELFKAQLLSDTPEAALLHALVDERAAEANAHAHDRLDTMLQVHAILTPEQRQIVAEELEAGRKRFEERRERFRSGRTRRGAE